MGGDLHRPGAFGDARGQHELELLGRVGRNLGGGDEVGRAGVVHRGEGDAHRGVGAHYLEAVAGDDGHASGFHGQGDAGDCSARAGLFAVEGAGHAGDVGACGGGLQEELELGLGEGFGDGAALAEGGVDAHLVAVDGLREFVFHHHAGGHGLGVAQGGGDTESAGHGLGDDFHAHLQGGAYFGGFFTEALGGGAGDVVQVERGALGVYFDGVVVVHVGRQLVGVGLQVEVH